MERNMKNNITYLVIIIALIIFWLVVLLVARSVVVENCLDCHCSVENRYFAVITAYSPVETCGECIMASGKYVYDGAIACPRDLPFGTKIKIKGRTYICEDRTHIRFDGRFDIFMQDYWKAIEWGKKELLIQQL